MAANDTGDWVGWFARRHNLTVRLESSLPGGVPAYKYEGPDGPVVVLDSGLPPERQHFSLAHEAAHILLGHNGELQPEEELEANRLASELLLPGEEFAPIAHLPLRKLKTAFPHASFEVIARRKLAWTDAAITVVDDGAVTRRFQAESFAAPPEPTSLEWGVISKCYREQSDISERDDDIVLNATYIGGSSVERVLLIVEPA